MTPQNNRPITWDDLKDEVIEALVTKWVRQTLRACFKFYAPIIGITFMLMISMFGWYANRVVTGIDAISANMADLTKSQSSMREQIVSNKKDINWMRVEWDKLTFGQ